MEGLIWLEYFLFDPAKGTFRFLLLFLFSEDIQGESDLTDGNGFVVWGVDQGAKTLKPILIEEAEGRCEKPFVEEDASTENDCIDVAFLPHSFCGFEDRAGHCIMKFCRDLGSRDSFFHVIQDSLNCGIEGDLENR